MIVALGFLKWAYLYIGCIILAGLNLNRPAAFIFVLALLSGRATSHFGLSQSHLLVAYILLAVVAVFFVDWVSGLALIFVTFAIILGMREVLDHVAKVRAGEVVLVLGMLFCGIGGPSGGVWANHQGAGDRRDTVAGYIQKAAVRIGAIPDEDRKTD